MSQGETSGTVHFRSTPDIVEIPRRSAWQRKWKPIKDRFCATCCAMLYVLCFPCVEVCRFCWVWCRSIKEDSNYSENIPNRTERRDSRNSYPRVAASQSLLNIPYTTHSAAVIKAPPPQLI